MSNGMPYLNVGRYTEKDQTAYAGYVEPADHSWILFIPKEQGAMPKLFARDPATGMVLPGQR